MDDRVLRPGDGLASPSIVLSLDGERPNLTVQA